MTISPNQYQFVREHEQVFRNILRDLKANKDKRPAGCYVPRELKTEVSLEEIFSTYCEGNRNGKFTITSFSRPDNTSARLGFKDIAPLSGGGTELEYLVNEDNSVEYKKPSFIMMS